ncbi:ribosome recycling factor [Candidatus Aerophobetes bacterium]|nr:ribosome recycling factor [Candidatus Aerophobetes bacterium]
MSPLKKIYQDTKKKMEQCREALVKKYATMRGGRANPEMVSSIKVECYGSRMELSQLSSISIPEARLIVVEPWDKSILEDIKKAILASNLGANPSDDGNLIRISLPPLSEERREELARLIRQWAEEAKVTIRNFRREAREQIEKMEQEKEISEDEKIRAEKEIQSLTDECIEAMDELKDKKVEEVKKI